MNFNCAFNLSGLGPPTETPAPKTRQEVAFGRAAELTQEVTRAPDAALLSLDKSPFRSTYPSRMTGMTQHTCRTYLTNVRSVMVRLVLPAYLQEI